MAVARIDQHRLAAGAGDEEGVERDDRGFGAEARALERAGFPDAEVRLVLQPAWTTDWMTDEGRAKLNEYGIAPPVARTTDGPIRIGMAVKCPRCHSLNTREITRFGSTSCKALYTCRECLEPFDYFKVH